MPFGGDDFISFAEEVGNGAGFGRRLDDDQVAHVCFFI